METKHGHTECIYMQTHIQHGHTQFRSVNISNVLLYCRNNGGVVCAISFHSWANYYNFLRIPCVTRILSLESVVEFTNGTKERRKKQQKRATKCINKLWSLSYHGFEFKKFMFSTCLWTLKRRAIFLFRDTLWLFVCSVEIGASASGMEQNREKKWRFLHTLDELFCIQKRPRIRSKMLNDLNSDRCIFNSYECLHLIYVHKKFLPPILILHLEFVRKSKNKKKQRYWRQTCML